ncbi:hypothetical protein [Alcanivorax sp.]|uniref:hypothetical protein n=1 Tax=Alcanivorax sp. TaxID=1872427 RepID=UPI0025B89BA5|nr:hypothetical protein [Alcanivorax sp.]
MNQERESTYESTAYNSQKKTELTARKNRSNDSYFTRVARGNKLGLPKGAHCQEYLAEWQCNIFQQDALQTRKPAKRQCEEMRDPHLMEFWPTLFEWPVFAMILRHGIAWCAFAGGIGGALIMTFIGLIDGDINLKAILGLLQFFFLPFFIAWLVLKLATKGEPKLKKDTRFFRRTGMVSIYRKGQDRLEIPFEEFEPTMTYRTGAAGSTGFMLQLTHRQSDIVISHINDYPEEYQVYLEWERLHQFMDISQPLPDRIVTEPARQFDPVTAEYDRKTERPKHLWRDMDREELRERREAAKQAAKDFPWGKTREQALASGWKPSEQRINWQALKEKQQTA